MAVSREDGICDRGACGIPADHLDLLQRRPLGTLATLLPDGQPQTQPVWFSYEAPCVLINTMRGFRKERNLRANPRATLLVVDPEDSNRWLEVRGLVTLTEAGARAHLDQLAARYAGVDRFIGGCVPAELAGDKTPVIGRLAHVRVVDEDSANHIPPRHEAHRDLRQRTAYGVELPASHMDLLLRPLVAVLSTLMPDGQPQTQPVWFGLDGRDLTINTTREKQKGRNLERDPRATLLIIDPANSNRWIEVRAAVEITEGGALDHLDELTRAYTPWPAYYGFVHPLVRRPVETRILCRLIPQHVVCDAIYTNLKRESRARPASPTTQGRR
jgi:PPOX class probable F420-dependent enzyme